MSTVLRIFIPILATALAIGGSEALLRCGGWGGAAVEIHAQMLRHDAQLGWRKQPSASVTYRWQRHAVTETSDERGARGSQTPDDASRPPVLFLGDSFCEGYLVNDDEVFSAVLGNGGLRTINHGVAGYSTDQELLLFREVVEEYKPSATVLLFFDNDVWFNAQVTEYRSAKPYFELIAGELVLGGVPVAAPDASIAASPAAERPREWRLASLLKGVARRMETPGASGPLEPVNEFLVYRKLQPESIAKAWRLTEELVMQLRDEAEAAGSEFVVWPLRLSTMTLGSRPSSSTQWRTRNGTFAGWRAILRNSALARTCRSSCRRNAFGKRRQRGRPFTTCRTATGTPKAIALRLS